MVHCSAHTPWRGGDHLEDPRCELCANPTPARPCPTAILPAGSPRTGCARACWRLNQPDEAVSIQTTTDARDHALLQEPMLTRYAMAWYAQQQDLLGARLGGRRQPGQASGVGGIQGLCG